MGNRRCTKANIVDIAAGRGMPWPAGRQPRSQNRQRWGAGPGQWRAGRPHSALSL